MEFPESPWVQSWKLRKDWVACIKCFAKEFSFGTDKEDATQKEAFQNTLHRAVREGVVMVEAGLTVDDINEGELRITLPLRSERSAQPYRSSSVNKEKQSVF